MQIEEIPGIGTTLAAKLRNLGAKTYNDLKKPEIWPLLPAEAQYVIQYHVSRSFDWDYANSFISALTTLSDRFTGVGSYRRNKQILADIDVLTTLSINEAVDLIKTSKNIKIVAIYSRGTSRLGAIAKFRTKYVRVDIFHTTPADLPFALLHHTGSANFNIRVRKVAKDNGYKLNQYGLFEGATNKKITGLKTERDILKYINVTYKKPEERNE
jgi:DNA polymerase/3'-5' exonuclease PolX